MTEKKNWVCHISYARLQDSVALIFLLDWFVLDAIVLLSYLGRRIKLWFCCFCFFDRIFGCASSIRFSMSFVANLLIAL